MTGRTPEEVVMTRPPAPPSPVSSRSSRSPRSSAGDEPEESRPRDGGSIRRPSRPSTRWARRWSSSETSHREPHAGRRGARRAFTPNLSEKAAEVAKLADGGRERQSSGQGHGQAVRGDRRRCRRCR
ncbi:MAG: hypothetical protein MZU79_07490 [Anaerotruncus sp.]|nr:hypothetical protein [Anaerotruncus sp.]